MTILGNMLQPLQGRGKAQKAPPHLVPAALRRSKMDMWNWFRRRKTST
jgi:hypothetical protein